MPVKEKITTDEAGLVNGTKLLKTIFPDEACRPSERWLRDMKRRRVIPYMKIGGLVFYDVPRVLSALAERTIYTRRG